MFYKLVIKIVLCSLALSATVRSAEILVLGDSLSAAYGLGSEKQGWVQLLADKTGFSVRNASITGETSSGGVSRIQGLLDVETPRLVLIELGGNDGLRGLSIKAMKQNLQQIIDLSQASGAAIMLIGVTLPPNYGAAFIRAFENIYTQLQQKNAIMLTKNILAGLENHLDWLQADGIHPSEAAQPMMMENIAKNLQPWLEQQTISK